MVSSSPSSIVGEHGEAAVLTAGALIGACPLVGYWLGAGQPSFYGLFVGTLVATVPFIWLWPNHRLLGDSVGSLLRLLLVALTIRFALLSVPSVLSEDLWRYLWDGMHFWAGLNPLEYAPNAAERDQFAEAYDLSKIRAQIGHAHLPSVYPPAAQLTFAIGAGFGPHDLAIRALVILADGITIVAIWYWAKQLGRPPQVAALFAFLPLSICESAIGGHIDAVGIAALSLGGLGLSTGRSGKASLALAWAAGIKLVPALLIGFLARLNRKAAGWTLVSMVALFVIFFLAYPADSSGLSTFGQRWRFNDGLFAIGYWLVESLRLSDQPLELMPILRSLADRLVGLSAPDGRIWPDELNLALTKALCAGAYGVCLVWGTLGTTQLKTAWLWIMGGLLLLSPVVHPWYLLWVMPAALLHLHGDDERWARPFLVWSLLIWLVYLPRADYLETGVWQDQGWIRWLEYGPVLLLLGLSAWQQLNSARETRSQ